MPDAEAVVTCLREKLEVDDPRRWLKRETTKPLAAAVGGLYLSFGFALDINILFWKEMKMTRTHLCCSIVFLCVTSFASLAVADCLRVGDPDKALKIDPDAMRAMSKRKLDESDFYRVMGVVAGYETGGCWAGSTGNSDNQWLSVGIMQWNFGQRTLQLLLHRFREKFPSDALFYQELDRIMPKYGRNFFAPACRTIPLAPRCKDFLRGQYLGKGESLRPEFKAEIDRLFESDVMRQIQVDRFSRSLTAVLDDLDRVLRKVEPAPWQVAWAMDLKTQQDRFPSDYSIKQIRETLLKDPVGARKARLIAIIKWYDGSCQSGHAGGVQNDCEYNVNTWTQQVVSDFVGQEREEAVHFTFLVSRTARNRDGLYQADAFQRRATTAFGKGSVHGRRVDLFERENLTPQAVR